MAVPRSVAMGSERLRQRAGVLAEPNFRRCYAGYVTSLLGSSMSTVAIAWAVLDSGAGATGLGDVFAPRGRPPGPGLPGARAGPVPLRGRPGGSGPRPPPRG